MAKRGFKYIIKRIRQVTILTIGCAAFVGLCFISVTQARNEGEANNEEASDVVIPSSAMQVLMAPAGSPIDRCLIPEPPPKEEECKTFLNIDEEVLQNLLQNYTKCLEGQSYYINFSNQPVVKLTKTLKLYGRTIEPLTIMGLRLAPAKDFPKDTPAIEVYGKSVNLQNIQLDGFEIGIVYRSEDNGQHRLIGGVINGPGNTRQAIAACYTSPLIEGTAILGYGEKLTVIKN